MEPLCGLLTCFRTRPHIVASSRREIAMIGHLPERHSLGIARVLLSLLPVAWGLVLLGLAMWLLRGQEPAAALPCLIFSAGYFWFAWSLFGDSAWEKAKAHRHLEEPPVLEPRTHSSPGGGKPDASGPIAGCRQPKSAAPPEKPRRRLEPSQKPSRPREQAKMTTGGMRNSR